MNSPAGLVLGVALSLGVVFGYPVAIVALALTLGAKLSGVRIELWRIVVVTAVVLLGAVRHGSGEPVELVVGIAMSDRAEGRVESIPVARPSGDRAIVRISRVRIYGEWVDFEARVVAYLPENRSVTIGDQIEVVWSFSPSHTLAPGFANYVRGQDAVGSASVFSVQVTEPSSSPRRFLVDVRRQVSRQIQNLVPGDAGALLSGIATGDDSALSAEARDDFNRTSTGHITAVSGSNVAMLLALWSRAFRSRSRRHHVLVQVGIIASVWAYCIATGIEASALRATMVATLVVISGRFGRRADPLTILALSTAGLLFAIPSLQASLGFWLSVSASAALAGSFATTGDENLREGFWTSIRALVAAQFATIPIIVWAFGTISVTGLLANLLVAPIMVVAFPLTFMFAALAFVPVLGQLFALPPALLSDLTLVIVERLAPLAPPILLVPSGRLAALVTAIPCACIVVWLSRDTQRWLPRWSAMIESQRMGFAGGVVGAAFGTVLAICLLVWFV